MSQQTTVAPSPEQVFSIAFGHIGARTLNTALELDLFTHIQRGANTLEALCKAAGTSTRGTRILTDALVGLGILTRQDGKLANTPHAEMFLSTDSKAYLGAVLRHADLVWERWKHLADAVRTGTAPVSGVETTDDDGAFFAKWVDGLFSMNFPAAQAVAKHLSENVKDVLDVGAGSAVWSLAFATASPQVRVTAVDREKVLDTVTRPFAGRMGCGERFTYKGGDFRRVDFGENGFDVVLLGHILHSEGPAHSRTLLHRCFNALRPGGKLAVAEFVTDNDHAKAVIPLLFGVNMLMLTEQGDVFSTRELEAMMQGAGFSRTEWLEVPGPSPILIAHKA